MNIIPTTTTQHNNNTMTAWTDHVKDFQAQHGCTYKEAMIHSRDSYTPQSQQTGGSFKSVLRKARRVKKKGRQVQQFANQHSGLIEAYDPKLAKQVGRASQLFDQADELTSKQGGRFKLKRFARKVKKGSKVASKALHTGAKFASFVDPRIGIAMEAGARGIDATNAATGGSFSVPRGGSFRVPKRGGALTGGCAHCGAATQSSLVSPAHPSFRPLKPKSMRELQYEN